MMNQETYELLEKEFAKKHIDEEVEDVLLELAEELAECNVLEKEVIVKQKYGKTVIEVCGICSPEDEEVSVLIRWMECGSAKIEIDDYFL